MKSDRNPHKIKEKTELPLESHRNPHRKICFFKAKNVGNPARELLRSAFDGLVERLESGQLAFNGFELCGDFKWACLFERISMGIYGDFMEVLDWSTLNVMEILWISMNFAIFHVIAWDVVGLIICEFTGLMGTAWMARMDEQAWK